jgi:uncharacterized membrane protein YeaQ/YmgE (transglycosylase-associated protein family)
MTILGFICFLVVAALCAGLANMLVPGRIPGGFLTAAIFGIIGGWIGGNCFGSFGPSFAGVSLLPTIMGSAILVLCFTLLGTAFSGRMKRFAR